MPDTFLRALHILTPHKSSPRWYHSFCFCFQLLTILTPILWTMNQKPKQVECFAQCQSAGEWWSRPSSPGKCGISVCRKLPPHNLLLGGEAGNGINHVNDHITHFVLNMEFALYTVGASEAWSWDRVLCVAICRSDRT